MAVIKFCYFVSAGTIRGLFSLPCAKWLCSAQWLADAVHPFGIHHAVTGMDRLNPML